MRRGSAGSWRSVADVSPVKSSLVRKADAWDLKRAGDGTDSVYYDAELFMGHFLCTLMYRPSNFVMVVVIMVVVRRQVANDERRGPRVARDARQEAVKPLCRRYAGESGCF